VTGSIAPWAVLLLIAALVGVLARRLRVPYSVGLVVAGIGLAVLPWHPTVTLSRELVYTGLLPPLIFEAAFELRWESLRRNLAPVVLLATLGVVLSALVTGAVMAGLAHWPLSAGLLFGILVAATDPVAVLATLREIGARGRLALLIEAESLLNDGTAAVLFAIAVGFVTGAPLTAGAVAATLGTTIAAGLAAGVVVAGGALAIIGRTDDHLIEVALTTVAAYGSFLLAEHLGGSGILATLTTGMLLGNLAPRWGFFSEAGDRAVRSTWEFITFLANSIVFLLIGLAEGHEDFGGLWGTAATAVVAVLAGRMAAVYPVAALLARGPNRIRVAQQHAMVWGGLRGALALALVLSIPDAYPWRHPIVATTFAVVAFSIIVQGLTCRPLLRRVCEADGPGDAGRSPSG
jgi:monovalent cation:H+ antiporter, CPA1 family